jgi:hypothetical protein
VHRVEAHLQSDESFFYTTDSPATTDMNANVDFGINFAKGQLFGYLLDDSGAGVGGITVELKNGKFTRRVATGGTGKFAFTGLGPGEYSVATLPDSYPPGYALQDLTAQTVTVEAGKPASAQFTVRALRSIAGRVLVYDKSTLQTVPLEGAMVRLKEPSLEIKTGPNGGYIFRNLAAGTYTISIEYGGKETTRTVVLPPAPTNLRDVDLNVGAKEIPEPKPIGLLNENTASPLNTARVIPWSTVPPITGNGARPITAAEPNDFCLPALWLGNPKGAKVHAPQERALQAPAAAKINQRHQSLKTPVQSRSSAVAAKANPQRKPESAAVGKVHRPSVLQSSASGKTHPGHRVESAAVAKTDQDAKPGTSPAHSGTPKKHLVIASAAGKPLANTQARNTQPHKIKASSASPAAALRRVSGRSPATTSPPSPAAKAVHCLSDPRHWQQ